MDLIITKELAEEFKKHFTCLAENTEKYITFTVPIEKVQELMKMKKKRRKEDFYSHLNMKDNTVADYAYSK